MIRVRAIGITSSAASLRCLVGFAALVASVSAIGIHPAPASAQLPPICIEYPNLPECQTALPGPPGGPGGGGGGQNPHGPGQGGCVQMKGPAGDVARVYDSRCPSGGAGGDGSIGVEPDNDLAGLPPGSAPTGAPSASGIGGGHLGTLPFTGYPMSGLLLLGLLALVLGLGLRAYRTLRERVGRHESP
jgi:hypothetical protein